MSERERWSRIEVWVPSSTLADDLMETVSDVTFDLFEGQGIDPYVSAVMRQEPPEWATEPQPVPDHLTVRG